MSRAVIYLPRFSEAAGRIASVLAADLVEYSETAFSKAVSQYREIAAVMSIGIAVRGIAPHLKDKWTDPALVVVTPDLRLAIPVTGGHHGANAMARELAPLGTIPVITTATEREGLFSVEGIAAEGGYSLVNRDTSKPVNAGFLDGIAGIYSIKGPAVVIGDKETAFLVADGEYSVGIGCRKDTGAEEIEHTVRTVLARSGIRPDQVFIYATTAKKSHESGILDAVRALGRPLLYLDDETINALPPHSGSRASRIGLSGVAEPCALATAKRRELVLEKTIIGGVTIAIAR
ncbi:MAG: cobalt-precorrin 5A hydrolase [Methanoregulaceae archaeon]|nr:cobalt-precorrin 5A hydrolase [Methanoregulaceae archaeon]